MTTEQQLNNPLPDYIEGGSDTPKAWRITNGKLRRGRQESEEVRERPILGYLKEITIWEGTTKDGVELSRLLVKLETPHGEETIGTYIRNGEGKPTMAGLLSLGGGIMFADKNEAVQIGAYQSDKVNRYGTHTTYARVSRVDPIRQKLIPRETKPSWDYNPKDYTWDAEGVLDLVKDLMTHPAYKAFDYGAPKEFLDWCDENGWPKPKDTPDAYLGLLAKALKREVAALSEVTAEEWTAFVASCKKQTSVPKALVDAWASKQVVEKGQTEDEWDPFADE